MNTPSWTNGPPQKVLLATDLSARCDRALDRAASLAAQWQASLVVLHVIEFHELDFSDRAEQIPSWRRPPDPATLTRQKLLADVGTAAANATVVIERGDPAEAVLRVAEAEGCDLIVTGVARDEPLGRFSLGKTVDRLLRRSRVPVLIVRDRVRGGYRHIVVATDLSSSSRHALQAASGFFPEQRLTVFHAYEAPFSGRVTDSASYQREYRKVAVRDYESFLESADIAAHGGSLPQVLVEQGPPEVLLRDYAREQGADLVVLGTHGRSAVFEVFLGSVAKAIVDYLPCDALLVREPRAAVETSAPASK